ncbi:serpin family protein [Bacteroidota bacterium]
MKQSIITLCLLIILGIVFSGCKSQKKSAEIPAMVESGFNASNLAESNNHFAIDLFNQIQSRSDNLVYSPYSISTVLAMTYSGASGKTADQMSEVLYFPPPGELEKASWNLKNHILSNDTLSGTEINLANAIWAQQNFDFLPEYIDKIKKWYDAPLTAMDFTQEDSREESRVKINNWVEKNTRDKIRDLIGPGVLDANTRMVLTNAIYFNGKWKWPFDKNLTAPSIFHVSSQESVMTEFMHLTKTFAFYEDEEIQALRLPYRGGRLSMTILLPSSVDGWELISRLLDHERLDRIESHFAETEVAVSLPKFTFESKLDLSKELSAMGMEQAFNQNADFSGMTGEKNLFIDEVIHQAFIEVSENGTEAAAATAAIISLKAALRDDPVRFNADHPFLYLIRDQHTGCIIFMGRLVKPS